jgi:hypothetical protein
LRYQLQVSADSGPAEKVWFEVVNPARVEIVHQDLAELEATAGSMVSPKTLVTTQVAYLASQGLLLDARLMLMAALADQTDDPAFRFLLGTLYERLGLPEQAAESFAQARVLVRSRAQ